MITLLKASIKEIELIREIANKTWFITYGNILSQEQLDYMFEKMYSTASITEQMTRLNHDFFIAYAEGIPQGYVSVEQQSKGLFHLHKLYVLPEAQGKGIGRALIEKAFDFARAESKGRKCALELNMNRNNKALDFYEKMGMHICGQGDFEIGNGYYMNDYIFRIELN
jgi:Acetyltransferases